MSAISSDLIAAQSSQSQSTSLDNTQQANQESASAFAISVMTILSQTIDAGLNTQSIDQSDTKDSSINTQLVHAPELEAHKHKHAL